MRLASLLVFCAALSYLARAAPAVTPITFYKPNAQHLDVLKKVLGAQFIKGEGAFRPRFLSPSSL
jgi:hypothetical protein